MRATALLQVAGSERVALVLLHLMLASAGSEGVSSRTVDDKSLSRERRQRS
jgi:hypothetical protein